MAELDRDARFGQFSLRTLFLAMSLVAGLAWVWRALGIGLCLTGIFALASLVPLAWRRATWRRQYLVAWAALYAPFFAMASYTLAWVPCDHCKTTVWSMLPYGPGLMPVGWAWQVFHHSRPPDGPWFAASLCVSMVTLAVLIWLLRRRIWLGIAMLSVTAAYTSFAAAVLLAMVRM